MTPPMPPSFRLHNWEIGLLPELFEKMLATDPGCARGYGSERAAAAKIRETLRQLEEAGYALKDFATWPSDQQTWLVTVLHIAAFDGVFRYPPLKPDAPAKPARLHADELADLASTLRRGRLTRADQRTAGARLETVATSVRQIEIAYNEVVRDAQEDLLLGAHSGQA